MSALLTYAVPGFLALLWLELWATRRRAVYRLPDMLTNLACGVGEQVLVATTTLGVVAYAWIQERTSLITVDASSPWAWIAVFVGVDFCYYWSHRACHRINFMWAAHAVHHQSEDFNLSVALRQSWFQRALSWPFYVPLVILGVPVGMIVTCYAINLIYQFWIHTPLIDRLGPLEYVFNTPSHHRVHHGVDEPYLDKNHAGVLIVWDRMFGTFTPEVATPRYGTVKPLRRFDAVRANVEPWIELWRRSKHTPRLADKLRVWFAPPEWTPPALPAEPGPLRTDPGYALYDAPLDRAGRRRAWAVFVPAIAGALALLVTAPMLPAAARVGGAVVVIAALGVLGGVLDRP